MPASDSHSDWPGALEKIVLDEVRTGNWEITPSVGDAADLAATPSVNHIAPSGPANEHITTVRALPPSAHQTPRTQPRDATAGATAAVVAESTTTVSPAGLAAVSWKASVSPTSAGVTW